MDDCNSLVNPARKWPDPIEVTVADAIALIRARRWVQPERWEFEVNDDGHWVVEEHRPRREMVHSRAGGFGCDIDAESAVASMAEADACFWRRGIFGWMLVGVRDDEVVCAIDELGEPASPISVCTSVEPEGGSQ